MGQNFLTDPEVAAWIVDQLEIGPEDAVLEIGPGMGALTDHILESRARHIFLAEKDARLAARMRDRMAGNSRVAVFEDDAVRLDMRPFFRHQPLKIIGALPYSCGTAIVRNVLHNPSPAARAVFTLQKEVCEKLAAETGGSHYGLLSLRTQARWTACMLRVLPPDIFLPRPDVESGVVALEPRARESLPVFNEPLLDRLLTAGFAQRRKMLRNLLPEHRLPWPDLCAAAGIPEKARGQELTLRQWIDLTNLYDDHALKDVPQRNDELFDVVDDADRVLRTEQRHIVHRDRLLHRAVHILVRNRHGEILLQKRSHLKDSMPGRWDSSAAGHLDAGEDYLSAAVRELREELGIPTSAESLTRLARIPASASTGWEFVELFSATWNGRVHWPPAEIETVAWFPPEEICAWAAARPQDFAEGFLECWRHCGGLH